MATIDNWPGMQAPLQDGVFGGMNQYYGVVTADTAAAAAIQQSSAAQYEQWRTSERQAWQTWYSNQSQNEIAWKQAALIAVKTAIDLVLAEQMNQRMRDIAADQRDLANRQLQMGEELHARYINKFAPIEDAAASFAITDWQTNRYVPQYNLQQGRARLDVARSYGGVKARLNRKMTRYCTGSNAEMLRLADIEWARNEVDAVNKAYRYEEAQMWRRDDLQWGRLQNVISNGQRLPSQAAADMNAGIRTATEANAMLNRANGGWYGALAGSAGNVFQWGYSQLETSRLQSMGLGTPMRVGYTNAQGNDSTYPTGWNQDSGFNVYTDAPYSTQNGGDGFLEGPVIQALPE